MKIYFATTNKNKLEEARRVLGDLNLELEMLPERKREIQSDSLEDIAKIAALDIAKALKIDIITEDSGLFVPDLKEFPGPYSSYVYKTIGCRGILDLMKDRVDRRAEFRAAVAYCSATLNPECFLGVVKGSLTTETKGLEGFGFDPIFIPNEGDGRTFAEMNLQTKNLYSHRGRAFRKFGEWIRDR